MRKDYYTCMAIDSPVALCAGLSRPRLQSVRDVTCMSAEIQFVRGVEEPSTPEVKLTRSRDGSNGTATFIFGEPSIFEASSDLGDITGRHQPFP